MTSVLPALVTHLKQTAALTALIGERIYPERLPESTTETPNTMPLITYQLLEEPVNTTHTNNNLFRAVVQIDAWGGSYKSADAVAQALFNALHGYKGNLGGVETGAIQRTGKRDASDQNVALHRIIQNFSIPWKEAA